MKKCWKIAKNRSRNRWKLSKVEEIFEKIDQNLSSINQKFRKNVKKLMKINLNNKKEIGRNFRNFGKKKLTKSKK